MEELAMAIKFASDAKLDLLTIDGSGGGTGMSPWNMMQSWGVPSILLHSKAYEYASILAAKGKKVVDMSFAGGFALEDNFQGACPGRSLHQAGLHGPRLMIPGFLGSNIEGALHPDRREKLNGNWDKLPASQRHRQHAEEIFASYMMSRKRSARRK